MLKKTYRFRLLLLSMMTLAIFGVVEARLYYLQINQTDHYVDLARRQQNKRVLLTPRRGDIVDCNGQPLATSYFSDTIVLDTRKMGETPVSEQLVADLANALTLPVGRVQGYFDKPRRYIVYRKAPQEVSQNISLIEDRYDLPDGVVIYEKHSKRSYPNGSLASHVLGFTQIDDAGDNIGLSGLEREYDQWLKGEYREQRIPISCTRSGLEALDDQVVESTYGHTLVLTLNKQLQMFTERALRKQVGFMQAINGVAVVMDVKTGEILALANCPDFDLNAFAKAEAAQRRNLALTDPLEIGSVMKIFTSSILLDNGLLNVNEMIDCTSSGYAVIDGRVVQDSHPVGYVPFHKAFAESSNIAVIKLSSRLEPNLYYEALCRFGLGQPTGIDLPGEGCGVLRGVEKWSNLSRSSLVMGYETSLTPIQVVSAVAAVGNNGWRMRPHLVREIRTVKNELVKRFVPQTINQVVSERTCQQVMAMMEEVINEGTGDGAQIPGYRLGGKTGTTRKHTPKGEKKRYFASFAGLLPIDNPQLAIYIYINEPKQARYGGTVAAPVFREIAEHAIHILGIPPNDPVAYEQACLEQRVAMEAPGATSATLTMHPALPSGEDESRQGDLWVDEAAEQGELDTAEQSPKTGAEGGVRMPDCVGMTMPQVFEALENAGIPVQLKGSGVAVSQEPAANGLVAEGQTATVVFAHPSVAAKTVQSQP